jgi:hypothetical protein
MIKYLLQMNGSVSQLRWTYEFRADDDVEAVKTAAQLLSSDRSSRSAHRVLLWAYSPDGEDEKLIHEFSFEEPRLVGKAAKN